MSPNTRWCAVVLAPALSGTWPDSASTYEEADYWVVRIEEGFALRRYGPYLVVETDAQGTFSVSRNGAFRRLFAYISGENVAKQEIEMTAPVVTQAAAEGSTMQFVLPSRFTIETAPLPCKARRWI